MLVFHVRVAESSLSGCTFAKEVDPDGPPPIDDFMKLLEHLAAGGTTRHGCPNVGWKKRQK